MKTNNKKGGNKSNEKNNNLFYLDRSLKEDFNSNPSSPSKYYLRSNDKKNIFSTDAKKKKSKNIFKVNYDYKHNNFNPNDVKDKINNNSCYGFRSEEKAPKKSYNRKKYKRTNKKKNLNVIVLDNDDEDSTKFISLDSSKINLDREDIKNIDTNIPDSQVKKKPNDISNSTQTNDNTINITKSNLEKINSIDEYDLSNNFKMVIPKNEEMIKLLGKKRQITENNVANNIETIDELIKDYDLENILSYLENPNEKANDQITSSLKSFINEDHQLCFHLLNLVYTDFQKKIGELNKKNNLKVNTYSKSSNNSEKKYNNIICNHINIEISKTNNLNENNSNK